MTDINKLIEEEAERYAQSVCLEFIEDRNLHSKLQLIEFARTDFLQGVACGMNLNRWRKVEEELPEEICGTFRAGKYEYTADKFLVKTRNNKYSLASRRRFLGHSAWSAWEWEGSCTFKSSVTEWKPIE